MFPNQIIQEYNVFNYTGGWLEFAKGQTVTPEDLIYDATNVLRPLPSALLVVAEEYKDVVWC